MAISLRTGRNRPSRGSLGLNDARVGAVHDLQQFAA